MRQKELLQAIYDTLQGMAKNQVKEISLLEKACGLLAENVQANESTAASSDRVCGYTLKISENTAPVERPEEEQLRVEAPQPQKSEHAKIQEIVNGTEPAQYKGEYTQWFREAAASVYEREGIEGLRKYCAIEFPGCDVKKKAHAVQCAIKDWKKSGKVR